MRGLQLVSEAATEVFLVWDVQVFVQGLVDKIGSKEVTRRGMSKRRAGRVSNCKAFRRQYLKKGTKKLTTMGLVLARVWRHKVLGICPTQRLKIRRRVAELLGKRQEASLGIFFEVGHIELEYEFTCAATSYCSCSRWESMWAGDASEAWKRQIFDASPWSKVQ